jgi:uncharacterized glyoxalase superfamily protein PhnB
MTILPRGCSAPGSPTAPRSTALGAEEIEKASTHRQRLELDLGSRFEERWRAGEHRAQLAVDCGAIAIAEQRTGTGWADQPDATAFTAPIPGRVSHYVMVRVDDVDAHHEHARERGARILHPPTDYPYGELQDEVEDPAGHRWTFSQTIADVAPEDWGGTRAASASHPVRASSCRPSAAIPAKSPPASATPRATSSGSTGSRSDADSA